MSKVVEVEVKDNCGLHAKKCMEICKLASKFTSRLNLIHNGHEIDLKSILGLMSLCVTSGEKVTILATGTDCDQAVSTIAPALI